MLTYMIKSLGLKLKLIVLFSICLGAQHLLAQAPQSVAGLWDFTYHVEKLDDKFKGTINLIPEKGGLTGLIQFDDLDNGSPIYKLNNGSLGKDNLSFVITEGWFAPMKADLKMIAGKLEGRMTLQISWMNFKGSGAFVATRQTSTATVDHAKVIRSLNENTLQQGMKLYDQVCAACHGKDGTSSLPTARSFNKDKLKFGADPFSMWKTITAGAGQMGAQRWLSAEDAYAVVQYIREKLMKEKNPGSYFNITDDYLEGLPRPLVSSEQIEKMFRTEALSGSQQYGQLYFKDHLGNYGPAMYTMVKDHANAGLTIKLAEGVYLSYNTLRMSTAAAWKGSFDLSTSKYQLYRGDYQPFIAGDELPGFDRMHWSFQDRYRHLENLVSSRTPFPSKWLHYKGHYKHGEKIILSYSIIGREILEMPSAELLNKMPVIQHTFAIAPGDSWRKIELGGLGERGSKAFKEGVFPLDNTATPEGLPKEKWNNPQENIIVTGTGNTELQQFIAAGVQGDTEGMRWIIEQNHQLALYIPPSTKKQIIRVNRYSGKSQKELENFAKFLAESKNKPVPDPTDYTKGGAKSWEQEIVLQGALDVGVPHYDPKHYEKEDRLAPANLVNLPENYPYVVDRIPLPFNNPWDSWIRPSGLDFLPDGRLVVSMYAGDVWIAKGIDNTLDKVTWQRIATGLYDPFGVKVVNGEIYVTCRDRIVRLKDLNGDGETDFYESFFADTDVSEIPVQAFNYSLQTDSKGNFIYSKGGQYTSDDEPGHIIRLTPDGKKQESIAIGFRAPNGVTIGPNDDIYASDNEGNWGPANKINLIKQGRFYGYIPTVRDAETQPGRSEYSMRAPLASPNYPEDILPDTFEEPIIWLPKEFDNSPGEGAWTPKEWGPLGGQLIHTSFGKGWVYQVLMQEVDGVTQAAVSAMPFQFEAGTQRARISPIDGQYYLAGITGWDDGFASKYGSLDRIRYVGGDGFFVDEVKVQSDGIAITFNQPLNETVAAKLENYSIQQWNYLWAEQYGSADWSVKNPEQEGRDDVKVTGVEISGGGKKLFLKISKEDLKPVDQMRIILSVESVDGQSYNDSMYLTIHKVPNENDTAGLLNNKVLWFILPLLALAIGWMFFRKRAAH